MGSEEMVQEWLEKVNEQKAFIAQLKIDKEVYEKSLLRNFHMIPPDYWRRVLVGEEEKLTYLRGKLSESRGE